MDELFQLSVKHLKKGAFLENFFEDTVTKHDKLLNHMISVHTFCLITTVYREIFQTQQSLLSTLMRAVECLMMGYYIMVVFAAGNYYTSWYNLFDDFFIMLEVSGMMRCNA